MLSGQDGDREWFKWWLQRDGYMCSGNVQMVERNVYDVVQMVEYGGKLCLQWWLHKDCHFCEKECAQWGEDERRKRRLSACGMAMWAVSQREWNKLMHAMNG